MTLALSYKLYNNMDNLSYSQLIEHQSLLFNELENKHNFLHVLLLFCKSKK